MSAADLASGSDAEGKLRSQVRSAVIWRSGTQVFSQLVAWASTFLVIRILNPSDYGLFAMTSVVLVLFGLLNGYGFANAAIARREAGREQLRQLFGLLIVINVAMTALQIAIAPLIAAYYRQPIVADMLRVQALIYLTNPFQALGYAVLSQAMDFRKQAQVNVVSALLSAATALGCALAGFGVWTLVAAPFAMFASRALGTITVARAWMWPSFDFKGAKALATYGGTIMAGQIFWFMQTQSDIIVAGRTFAPHELGFYTTALFLSQIFVTKVVPPLNEVAFSAYARIQDDLNAVSAGFLKSLRVIMTIALPFCMGLAAVAYPAVKVMLGDKWMPAAPIVQLLSLAMPFMTLHVLFGPAANACGHPRVTTRSAILGAVLMPLCYLVGVQWGAPGIAASWLVAYPLLTLISAAWIMPLLGVTATDIRDALLPPGIAALAMALGVTLLDRALPAMSPLLRLSSEVATGGAIYAGWMATFARDRLREMLDLVLKR
ncbi:MAG: lipopolysaccharide biosynthesis protein [Novosphingobium sp.]